LRDRDVDASHGSDSRLCGVAVQNEQIRIPNPWRGVHTFPAGAERVYGGGAAPCGFWALNVGYCPIEGVINSHPEFVHLQGAQARVVCEQIRALLNQLVGQSLDP
jgi:hypothetical protein